MRVQLNRRSNLHHLLMPSLNGTVSLIQMDHISILITWERKRKGGTGKGWRKQKQSNKQVLKKPYLIFLGFVFQALLSALFPSKCALILQTPTELITRQGSHLVNKIIRVQEKWLLFVSRSLMFTFRRCKMLYEKALLVKKPLCASLLKKPALTGSGCGQAV